MVLAPVGLALGHAVEVGRQALEVGADALLLMPPVHPYLCDAGFRDYVQAITDAVPLPLLTYKRGPVPSDKLLLELAGEGRLVGVKYAVNELDGFARFAAAAGGRLGLYCGTAERYAPFFMLAGAAGYTSGSGCLAPRLTLALHAALAAGNTREAVRLLQIIRPLEDARGRDGDSYNISLVKFWLEECGHPFGPPRPPGAASPTRRRPSSVACSNLSSRGGRPGPDLTGGADPGVSDGGRPAGIAGVAPPPSGVAATDSPATPTASKQCRTPGDAVPVADGLAGSGVAAPRSGRVECRAPERRDGRRGWHGGRRCYGRHSTQSPTG